ncbi:GNAT family N-acetyltransferase [Methylocella silvestris]|uniref:GNAT family N-acetyltransferase n=1 Tax=Methylocella silvestris TaxID=199596 RepID=UPI0015E11D1E|nr:N-acetyltransferase [Methylocella silvestris]
MTFVLTPVQANVAPLIALAREPVIHIAEETPGDVFARENLLDAAFGETRFEKACERLREGRLPARGLALSMKDGNRLIGTVRLWHIDAGGARALMLGPLAIDAAYRSQGLGRRMMAEALWRAQSFGHRAILLVGDAPYYVAFGFSRSLTLRLEMPGPVDEARFLGLELAEGALRDARGLVLATGVFAERELLAA